MSIDEPFYPLTHKLGRKLREAKLTAAEWRLWSYLVELDPYGEKYLDFDSQTVMQKCDISKTTLWRSMCKLQELGLFDFQDKGFHFKNEMGVSKMKQPFQKRNEDFKNETEDFKNETAISKMKPEISKMKSSEAETPAQQGSQNPSEIKIYKDFTDSLSEGGEREKFFKFVKEKIREFNPPINDLEAWLASQTKTGNYNFRVYYAMFQKEVKKESPPSQDFTNHPQLQEWLEACRENPAMFVNRGGPREERPLRLEFKEWAESTKRLWGELET
ncbi:MAG: hypothetical protein F6K24_27315 [Okeania sp. SIO2D1]|nr:hypothetical protein [Okeania sp. SIO2D1]